MARLNAMAPVAIMILAALGLTWLAMRPPEVIPVDAPARVFSAARAIATVRMVSAQPHPAGSAGATAVRRALVVRLHAMGLNVYALDGVGAGFSSGTHPSAQAGEVETLVAILPGRNRALPAVAIMAHTDSVPGSFGAADDGFGVAVALETARALAADGPPARDLVLILTDDEEAGLLGARLFFADPVRARRIGTLINVDSRGTSGLGAMFETGPRSGGLLARYRSVAGHRFAHSAATFLYHQLPNRTDLSATAGFDIPALNFAFLADEFDYHTPLDRLASVDPRTLQSLGDQVLPVVRSVADDPATLPRTSEGVFADAAPVVAVRYPDWVGWPLLALTAILALSSGRGARLLPTARAAAGMVAAAILAALIARLGFGITGVADDWGAHHRIMAVFDRYELALALSAGACLLGSAAVMRSGRRGRAIAIGCLVAGLLAVALGRPPLATGVLVVLAAGLCWVAGTRPIGPTDLRAGTMVVGLALSLTAQALAPALTPLIVWPALAATAGAAIERCIPLGRWGAATLGVFPMAYLLVFGHAVLLALGIPTPEAVGVFVLFAAPIVMPIAGELPLAISGTAFAIGAALMLSIRPSLPSERHPALSQLYGVTDADGHNWLVSPLERPDQWTHDLLRHGGEIPLRAAMPLIADQPVWRVPTSSRAPTSAPTIEGVRHGDWIWVIVSPTDGGRTINLSIVTDRPLRDVSVGGQSLAGFAGQSGSFKLRWQSAGSPVTLRFRASAGTHLAVTAAEWTKHRLRLPPRPAAVVPWLDSDRWIVMRRAAWHL